MLTVWPGTPSVRTCCASLATDTLTSRLATFLYTSRRCKALWLATTAQRSSASMSIPCLLWRCLRCVVSQSSSGGSESVPCGHNVEMRARHCQQLVYLKYHGIHAYYKDNNILKCCFSISYWEVCGENLILLVVLMVCLLLCPVGAHVPVPGEEDV